MPFHVPTIVAVENISFIKAEYVNFIVNTNTSAHSQVRIC